MSDQSTRRHPDGGSAGASAATDPLTKAMNALAELGASAAGSGAACLISWQRLSNGGAAYAPADSRWEPALWAILGLLWRRDGADGVAPNFSLRKNAAITKPLALRMSAAEVALRCGRAMPVQTRLEALGVACAASPTAQASVVLLMPQGISVSQSDALIELIQRQALAELALSEESASLWFWRDRAATAAERLATERAATRRGWVWAITPSMPRPMARQIFGNCVVLPEPVSPQTITTWLREMAWASSSRFATTGRSAGYSIGCSRSMRAARRACAELAG